MTTEAQIRAALPIARSEARRYFYPSGDRDEVLSDALYGLVLAAKAWNGSGSFNAFARICIRRQLGTGLKRTQRATHMILTGTLRHQTDDEGTVQSADVFIPDLKADVHMLAEHRWELSRAAHTIRYLPSDQKESFVNYLNGEPISDKGDDSRRFRARVAIKRAVA